MDPHPPRPPDPTTGSLRRSPPQQRVAGGRPNPAWICSAPAWPTVAYTPPAGGVAYRPSPRDDVTTSGARIDTPNVNVARGSHAHRSARSGRLRVLERLGWRVNGTALAIGAPCGAGAGGWHSHQHRSAPRPGTGATPALGLQIAESGRRGLAVRQVPRERGATVPSRSSSSRCPTRRDPSTLLRAIPSARASKRFRQPYLRGRHPAGGSRRSATQLADAVVGW